MDPAGTTERVLTLLGLLQQRQVWTGAELAGRLGVTARTVRRDVERLRTLGYPVLASQGVGGGYQLGPGQDLPPLLFDDEEAIATAVSLLAGAGGAVATAGDAALRALTKLDRVLPVRLRHEVRALSGSVESFGGGRTPVDREVLMTLARACRDEVEAGFDYPGRSGVRRRRVEPYRLVTSDRRWYLLAYDLERDDWRSFRVDRMTDVSARTWRFRPRAAPDAATYVQEAVASRVYRYQARFLVHAPADTVRAQIPASAAVVRARDEHCEVRSGAADLDFVLMHMVLLGHDFEVLDPPELRTRCRVLAKRLLSAGQRPSGDCGYGIAMARIEHLVTSGTFSLDGGTWDVDNNVWLVGDDAEVVIIDAAHDADRIVQAVDSRRVVAIVCTHGHDDHIDAAPEVARRTGAAILLHPADLALWRMRHPDTAPSGELADGQDIVVAGVALTVLHTPGHSPGAVCLYASELGTVFSGDTLFQGGPGATGRSFSDFPTIIDSIRDRLLTLPPDTVVRTGHGPQTTIGAEAPALADWVARGH